MSVGNLINGMLVVLGSSISSCCEVHWSLLYQQPGGVDNFLSKLVVYLWTFSE